MPYTYDTNGNLAADMLFYPFGEQWTTTGSWVDTTFASLWPQNLTFDLNPSPNRYQSPSLGRWMSPDPLAGDITNPQSWKPVRLCGQ